MDLENETVSGWFVLNSGFKVYGRCPACHSPRLSYFKIRTPGMKGISPGSQGLSPVCIDCGKSFPKEQKSENKKIIPKSIKAQRSF